MTTEGPFGPRRQGGGCHAYRYSVNTGHVSDVFHYSDL